MDKTTNGRDKSNMAATPNKLSASIFACYAWACYCLLQKQWERAYDSTRPMTGFIHYPVQWLCVALIFDNIRLLLGSAYGKEGASMFLGHVWQFMHMIGLPLALSALAALFGYLVGFPWLRFVGGSVAVFYFMNGLNSYVSTVHGALIYKDDDNLARYTVNRNKKLREGEPPVLLLPPVFIMAVSLAVTFVAMVTAGDVIPFCLQLVTIIGHFTIPTYNHNKHLLINLIYILALASIIRTERYILMA